MLRRRRGKHHRWGRARTSLSVADEWREWIADNLMRGHEPTAVRDALVKQGLPEVVAEREIADVAGSPLLRAGRKLARRGDKRELVLRLRRELAALSEQADTIEQLPTIDGSTFFERYYCTNTPLVLTDMMRDWPALKRWGTNDLVNRFGAATVEICSGRNDDPDPDMNYHQHLEKITVRDLVSRLRRAGETNDFYLIANNRAMERSSLRPLLDDVIVPDFIEAELSKGSTSLWIGPAGTVTPMHHDTCNILFCQVVGKKRFRLIDPTQSELLEAPNGFYSTLPPERVAALPRKEVVLEPGMALFLPVGWWHDVRALELSMSISLLNFRRPFSAQWYTPGEAS